MKLADSWTNFKLIFHVLSSKTSELIYEDEKVSVHTIPLDHRIYTNGFLFKEKPFERKLDIEKAEALNIDKAYFRKLKQGDDVVNEEGTFIPNAEVTYEGHQPKSYAFCSDTAYKEDIIPLLKMLMYCITNLLLWTLMSTYVLKQSTLQPSKPPP